MGELEILKGWAPQAYGIWVIASMMAIYFFREWRETRKLSSTDRQARREGFERQVEILIAENRRLGDDLRALRLEYDEYRRICQEENEQRLLEIRRLENQVAGLKRQQVAHSVSAARLIQDIETDHGEKRQPHPKGSNHER